MTHPCVDATGKPILPGMTITCLYRSRLQEPSAWLHARLALVDIHVEAIHADGSVTASGLGPRSKAARDGRRSVPGNWCYVDLREGLVAFGQAFKKLDKADQPRKVDAVA